MRYRDPVVSIARSAAQRFSHFDDVTGDVLRESQVIDAGTYAGITADFEANPRPFGAGADIGFDECIGVPGAYLPVLLR